MTSKPEWLSPLIEPDDTRKRELLEEALQSFELYYVPEIQAFLRTHDLPVAGIRNDLIERIRRELLKGTFPPEDLFDYLDRLKENSYQYIFLFKLRKEHQSHLANLKKESYVQEQLKKYNLEDRLTKPPLVWESESPQLAAVSYQTYPEGKSKSDRFLQFKWIETRIWLKQVKEDDEDGLRIIRMLPQRERSANFFRLDLRTGEAEIRIQMLQPHARKSLRAEFDLYRQQLNDLIQFEFFSPVFLEPVVRRLLTSRALLIKNWRILLRETGPLGGNGSPSLLEKLGVMVNPAVGLHLSGDWFREKGKGGVTMKVDGKNDRLEIPGPEAAIQVNKVLSEIRHLSGEAIEISQLKEVAKQHGELSTELEKLDSCLRGQKSPTINLDKLAESQGLSPKRISQAAEQLSRQYPELFSVKYYVLCPEGKRFVRDKGGKAITYANLKDVPKDISCLHKRKSKTHQTAGNIRQRLIALRPISPPGSILSEGLKYLIEERFPGRIAKRIIDTLYYSFFVVLFAYMVIFFGGKSLSMVQGNVLNKMLAVVMFLMVMLALVALLVIGIGARRLLVSLNIVQELLSAATGAVRGTKKVPTKSMEDALDKDELPQGKDE